MIFYIIIILIFAIIIGNAEWKGRRNAANEQQRKQAEMESLKLNEYDYHNYLLNKYNKETISQILETENVTISPVVLLHQINGIATTLSYDRINGFKYWETHALIAFLFNAKLILVIDRLEPKKIMNDFHYLKGYSTYCSNDFFSHTLKAMEKKMTSFSNLYNIDKKNYHKGIMELGDKKLGTDFSQELKRKIATCKKSINAINNWADRKSYEQELEGEGESVGNSGIGEWAWRKTNEYYKDIRRIQEETMCQVAYEIFMTENKESHIK